MLSNTTKNKMAYTLDRDDFLAETRSRSFYCQVDNKNRYVS